MNQIKLIGLAWAVSPKEAARVLPILEIISAELNENLPSQATVNLQGYFNLDRVNAIGVVAEAVPEKLTFWQKYFKRVIPKMEIHIKLCVAQLEYV